MKPNQDPLADPEWVSETLSAFERDDPAYRLLEVDIDTSRYDRGHIPGAISVDWENDVAGELGRDIVDADAFEAVMEACGVTNDTTLVLYGDEANWFAAHVYWVCKYYGHDDVRLMDGGRHYWNWHDYEWTTAVPSVTPGEYTVDETDETIRAYEADVKRALETEQPIIDVRNPQEYRGGSPPPEIPKTTDSEGHIPGAENVPWAKAVRPDGSFKSKEQLREVYDVDEDDSAVAYCRIGERASVTWFVLHELLGVDATNYDGSWTEWSQLEDAPIETGEPGASSPVGSVGGDGR
ncbi:sulfurtransferase [Natronobacterium gregoryi]|nr:sulfurtransferase [Natronobacterium gregoryi]ELY73564.1 rhodanese-like protein [Natronobacterium gregoryi SP2]PLK19408.1 sulfurtransferase [Natronobacterium gregoryi SP2]